MPEKIEDNTEESVGSSQFAKSKPIKQAGGTHIGMVDVKLPSGAVVSYPLDIAFYLQTDPAYTEALQNFETVVQAARAKQKKVID